MLHLFIYAAQYFLRMLHDWQQSALHAFPLRNYAVKLRASAPSIHMLRAQIETEISPMVGGEQESQQLIDYLLGEYEEDTDKLWQSNIFGKSLYELVSEGVTAKIMRMPDDARQKLTKTLGRMINENTGGMICILL